MDKINVVCGSHICNIIKNYNGFEIKLGSIMKDVLKQNVFEKSYNNNDPFCIDYNLYYKTYIQSKGNIGNIRFYEDLGIKTNDIAFYINNYEYVFQFDIKECNEIGIGQYIGKLVYNAKELYNKENNIQEVQKEDMGDANKIIKSPGSVTYKDIEQYIKQKRKK